MLHSGLCAYKNLIWFLNKIVLFNLFIMFRLSRVLAMQLPLNRKLLEHKNINLGIAVGTSVSVAS